MLWHGAFRAVNCVLDNNFNAYAFRHNSEDVLFEQLEDWRSDRTALTEQALTTSGKSGRAARYQDNEWVDENHTIVVEPPSSPRRSASPNVPQSRSRQRTASPDASKLGWPRELSKPSPQPESRASSISGRPSESHPRFASPDRSQPGWSRVLLSPSPLPESFESAFAGMESEIPSVLSSRRSTPEPEMLSQSPLAGMQSEILPALLTPSPTLSQEPDNSSRRP
jgi:hypothetical protein